MRFTNSGFTLIGALIGVAISGILLTALGAQLEQMNRQIWTQSQRIEAQSLRIAIRQSIESEVRCTSAISLARWSPAHPQPHPVDLATWRALDLNLDLPEFNLAGAPEPVRAGGRAHGWNIQSLKLVEHGHDWRSVSPGRFRLSADLIFSLQLFGREHRLARYEIKETVALEFDAAGALTSCVITGSPTAAARWQSIPLDDASLFDERCEHRFRLEAPGNAFASGMYRAQGVTGNGQVLIYVSHQSQTSNIRSSSKTEYWVNNSPVAGFAITLIERRCDP